MSTVQTDYLAISWSVSRGVNTYGYNICRLDVRSNGKRYKCNGGGYDMTGTCVGMWLQDIYQHRIFKFAADLAPGAEPYGLRYHFTEGRKPAHVTLDGACGVESMIRIAEAIGISMSRTYNRKGHTTGYMVTDYGSAEALKAAQVAA